ncbi:hypothetical protein SAMN02745784_02624 [Tissierella praeacuta DSM 18095]|uniref:DUF3784 domain-containing protein n=1 Tax=Tissierella praeacuta DSM 18095 TaxID=1123404 RepID=A0A1M4YG70_9FIRM|nr:hypothetical protein [Tissierella praeacuta]SHF04653.1 hypothetical protein SAMN02745784_02624 [Tissierella praeacuta DSM 18095]SUP02055.1 Uncharacterised protein [Tissierella praeacuta]
MNNKEYKKTYKPLIAWLIGFPVIAIIIAERLSNLSTKIATLLSLIIMVISLYILMFIIYKGEYVYWINGGPNYEEAKLAGSEKRKEYAKAHLDIFFKMMLISFLYGILSLLLKFPIWIDIVLISVIIIITAFSTISIKFNK